MVSFENILKAIEENIEKCSDNPKYMDEQIKDGLNTWNNLFQSWSEEWYKKKGIEFYPAPKPESFEENEWGELLKKKREEVNKLNGAIVDYHQDLSERDKELMKGFVNLGKDKSIVDGIIDYPTLTDNQKKTFENWVKKGEKATTINDGFIDKQDALLDYGEITKDWTNIDNGLLLKSAKGVTKPFKKMNTGFKNIRSKYEF